MGPQRRLSAFLTERTLTQRPVHPASLVLLTKTKNSHSGFSDVVSVLFSFLGQLLTLAEERKAVQQGQESQVLVLQPARTRWRTSSPHDVVHWLYVRSGAM